MTPWVVGRNEARDVDVQERGADKGVVDMFNLGAGYSRCQEEHIPHVKHPTLKRRFFSPKADHPAGLGTDRNTECLSHDSILLG